MTRSKEEEKTTALLGHAFLYWMGVSTALTSIATMFISHLALFLIGLGAMILAVIFRGITTRGEERRRPS